jgi:hypothetical protein
MKGTKMKCSKSIYYCFRYLGWVTVFTIFITRPIDKLLDTVFSFVVNSPIFIFFSTILIIALDIYFHKIALKKTFFKEYKHITINPKFKGITNSFNIKSYIKLTLASLGAFVCILLLYCIVFEDVRVLMSKSVNSGEFLILTTLMLCHWTVIPYGLIFCITVRLLLLKRIVIKNAEISYSV